MTSHKELDTRLAFRLPLAVAETWRAAARDAGLSLSDWIRKQVHVDGTEAVITHKPSPRKAVPRPEVVPVDPALVMAVSRAGNNLNQIARSLNRGEAIRHDDLLVILVEIERRLVEILDRCTSSS